MEDIPPGTLHGPPSGTRIMVSEPVDHDVPHRLIMFHEKTFCQGDPDGYDGKIAAREIPQFEVLGLLDTLTVLPEPLTKFPAPQQVAPTLSGPDRDCFAERKSAVGPVALPEGGRR